ncbi:nicotinamide riboside transporter PnuC [Ferrimonas gelatinilytica]|uniref:Nicotinamide riboside transporter PnuC n=1 Tax=Ferrimonas gelatinilytica TaxID=1255257 RepID=A0ABP9RUK8_9GAMM
MWADAHALTGWEALAVALAVAYLLLAMRQSQWCWACAALSTLIFTGLFWHVSLLMESLLNLFYLVMAAYGYWQWRSGGENGNGVALVRWSWRRHAVVISATAGLALLMGYLMDTHTHADLAYLDAMTTCFAVVTTFMVVRKVVENWLYWIVINSASIYLYLSKGLALSSGLYLLYVVLAWIGYQQWRQQFRLQPCPSLAKRSA